MFQEVAILAPNKIKYKTAPKYRPFCSYGPPGQFSQVNAHVDATCVFLIYFLKKLINFFLIKKTHVVSTSALTWSKLAWGAKTAKGAVLYFTLLEGQNRNFLKHMGSKLLLSQKTKNIILIYENMENYDF